MSNQIPEEFAEEFTEEKTKKVTENTRDHLAGETGVWEMVIGLEVHAQIATQAKLFSGAATAFGAAPNSQVSLVDAAMPGMLPVINGDCVRHAVRTGLAMGCKINSHSVFARKNYFYADLPQGYQISQYDKPIVGTGEITIDLEDGETRKIGIERLHLEQDAGKSLHDQHPSKSFIDLNRSGVALMEIVSKPDMRSAAEATAYLTKLRSILRAIGACDGNMAEGSMRADVNLSVRRPGAALGTRTELKNINSIRFVRQAIAIESQRQIAVLEAGGEIIQETRLFDPNRGETRAMRSKEEAHDYRYFPDPDLLPLEVSATMIAECQASLPELPDAKKQRFIRQWGLSPYDAALLVDAPETAIYFEKAAALTDPKLAANWIISEVFARLNKQDIPLDQSAVGPEDLAELINLVRDNTISGKIAKEVFDDMFKSGKSAKAIVADKGLKQISDGAMLATMIDRLVADNPAQLESYRGGKTAVLGWFVGQVMKQTQGKANPAMVNQMLKAKLDG